MRIMEKMVIVTVCLLVMTAFNMTAFANGSETYKTIEVQMSDPIVSFDIPLDDVGITEIVFANSVAPASVDAATCVECGSPNYRVTTLKNLIADTDVHCPHGHANTMDRIIIYEVTTLGKCSACGFEISLDTHLETHIIAQHN